MGITKFKIHSKSFAGICFNKGSRRNGKQRTLDKHIYLTIYVDKSYFLYAFKCHNIDYNAKFVPPVKGSLQKEKGFLIIEWKMFVLFEVTLLATVYSARW